MSAIKKIIPNILTIIRIILIPILVISFYFDTKTARYLSVSIFTFASITDYIDGALARKWKAHSNLGRMLDPIADKMIVSSTLLMMVSKGIAPVLPTVVILCREIFVSGIREYLAEIKVIINVSVIGKVKTILQMTSIIILLCGSSVDGLTYLKTVGSFALWFAAILTVVSGYIYVRENIHHI
ncbi:CDP-diacylglycerol--glycerol-3-phosphate 3-phosphatidyltransferase [Lyticum sinuosum]|uniref:CDP-diacylglycerol--glycerol-3-phosphate 3-phosphatidyltransferase n=1 Tax=Lyticum sinuosum TaxID=1332059 RepID=UPI002ACEC2DB|nr:CDP-diacylglycerol--glycerol-3-phosphate 3-phosphatidyltransferase [Lyticum sinuosum]